MNSIDPITIDYLRTHEQATNANVRLGGYKMDEQFPTAEIKCYRVELDGNDLERLFVLWDFAAATEHKSCRLVDVLQTQGHATAMENVPQNTENDLNLATSDCIEPILMTTDLATGSLTITDGNHRMMAHYLGRSSVDGVCAYVAVHPMMNQWGCIPLPARRYVGPDQRGRGSLLG